MKFGFRVWPDIVYTGRGSQRLCWKRFENPDRSEAAAGRRRSYLVMPLPSVMVSFRSTPEMLTVVDDNIEPAIAVEVCDRQTSSAPRSSQAAVRRSTHAFKFSIAQISKKQSLLRIARAPLMLVNSRVDMAVGHDQIQPTVVIKIEKARSPTKKRQRNLAESGQESYISEIGIAV